MDWPFRLRSPAWSKLRSHCLLFLVEEKFEAGGGGLTVSPGGEAPTRTPQTDEDTKRKNGWTWATAMLPPSAPVLGA